MISACILTRNDEYLIGRTIESIRPFVQEIIVVDDNSTDNTIKIAKESGADIVAQQVVDIPEKGFAEAANMMISYASREFVFIIDSDELLSEGHKLQELIRFRDKEAWALPRRKWKKYPIEREEYEAYPDWQVRFFKNIPSNRFSGEMHVRFNGSRVFKAYKGPHIEHLQRECRTPEKEEHRKTLYKKLAEKQNVEIVGGSARVR